MTSSLSSCQVAGSLIIPNPLKANHISFPTYPPLTNLLNILHSWAPGPVLGSPQLWPQPPWSFTPTSTMATGTAESTHLY